MLRSSNPTLGKGAFTKLRSYADGRTMTIQGTVNKTGFLLLITFIVAMYTWNSVLDAVAMGYAPPMQWMWLGSIGGLIVALITVFKKHLAMYTAPIYALLEGLFLGAVSALFEMRYPGVVMQAVLGTFGVFFMMIFLYKSRIIKVTENFKLGVVAATGGIFLVYMLSMVMGFFGVGIPLIHEGGTVGIIFSLVVIGIAAMNLVMDFDFIEKGESIGAPKYMEWYGAFALLVTLVWLYMEMLRLLSKVNKK